MSFSMDIKNEISSFEKSKTENIAELSAFVRNNAKIGKKKIVFTTENFWLTKRIILLFKDLYQVNVTTATNENLAFDRGKVFEMIVDEKVETILMDLSVFDLEGKRLNEPKEYIVPGDEEKRAYLAGVFLACGSISDPGSSRYHLEFLISNKYEAVFVQRLINAYDLNCKVLKREKKYMIYVKEAEKISDFLKLIGASKAVIYYENERVYRFQKNTTNRLNNCEQANVDKIIATATRQVEEIQAIKEEIGLNLLDTKTKEAAEFRLKYPESSLLELAEIMSIETKSPITKSGLNHRLRKISKIASNLKGVKAKK